MQILLFQKYLIKVYLLQVIFFSTYKLEIEKQRYFSSVTYYNNVDSGTSLEIGETATGLFLSLTHVNNLNNQYSFSGEN